MVHLQGLHLVVLRDAMEADTGYTLPGEVHDACFRHTAEDGEDAKAQRRKVSAQTLH